jgi:hypothetical protein
VECAGHGDFGWSREDALGRALSETIIPERIVRRTNMASVNFFEQGLERS